MRLNVLSINGKNWENWLIIMGNCGIVCKVGMDYFLALTQYCIEDHHLENVVKFTTFNKMTFLIYFSCKIEH